MARQRIDKHLTGQRSLELLGDQEWHQCPERRLEGDLAPPRSHGRNTDPIWQLHSHLTTASSPGRETDLSQWEKETERSSEKYPFLGFLRAV